MSPKGPKPRALLFDLDDTLYPLRRFLLSGFRAVASHLAGREGLADRVYELLARSSRGPRRGQELQACAARFDLPPAIVPELVDVIRAHAPALRLPLDSRRTLAALRRRGWRLGIVTNGLPDLQAGKIEALGLRALVDVVILANAHTRRGKPDCTPFAAALRALGVPAARAVFAGDDDVCDLFGASRAGLRTVYVGRHARGPRAAPRFADAEVAALAELPAVAEGLLQERRGRRVA